MGRTEILRITAIVAIVTCAADSCYISKTGEIPHFDRNRAFSYLEYQVALGPRVPGTKTHEDAMNWIVGRLRTYTPRVQIQQFQCTYAGNEVTMHNILASFYSEKRERVLLCAHWDSRHHADRDPDAGKWLEPVPGANDGASGVAVLLEIAAALTHLEPSVGVDIVLFDGEDGGTYGDNTTWLLGSRHFARTMPPSYRPKYAILLDMIGDSDLVLSKDVNSIAAAPDLWNRIRDLCVTLAIPVSSYEMDIVDDHIPLIERGIPAIDLIDFDYPSWHTVSDTPDKCSAESLEKIGTLVLTLIYGE